MKEPHIGMRVSYKLFKQLLDFLNTNPSHGEVLKEVFRLLDSRHSFGSRRNADAAYESLEQVLADTRQADE